MTEDEFLEQIKEDLDLLDTEDVAQKRYLMHSIFERLLEKNYENKGRELPGLQERIKTLEKFDGYMYKLAQDFLMESSTMKKEQNLEKMADHIRRKIDSKN